MKTVREDYPLSVQAVYVFIGRTSAFALSFVTPIILVRILSQAQYGLYQQALLICVTLVETVKWGLLNSLFYFYPLAKANVEELLSQTFYLLVGMGVALLGPIYLLRHSIAHLFRSDVFLSLWSPLMVYFLFMLISLILNSLFILEKRSKTFVLYEVLNQSLRILLVLGAAAVYRNVYMMIWGLSALAILRSAVLYVYLKKRYHISLRKVNFSRLLPQIRYSFPIGAARLVGEVGRRVDKFILSAFLSSANYAVYAVAHMRIPLIELLYTSVGHVVIPRMTEHGHKQEWKSLKNLWHKMILKNALVTIPAVVFLSVSAKPVITSIYTSRYTESVNLFRILLLISLGHMINPSTVLRSCGETKVIFVSHLCSMITAILLSYMLIRNYGMVGGAVAVLLSSYVRTTVQAMKVKQILRTDLADLLPWASLKGVLLCSLLIGSIPLTLSFTELKGLPMILAGGTLYFSAVLIVFLRLRYFRMGKVALLLRTVIAQR